MPSSHLHPSAPTPPFSHFYLCLLLILLLLFSSLNAHVHTHTPIHTHVHTHLSVICMRWFLMHLGPRGSSHSNLHQHPLPWLFVCVCAHGCMCVCVCIVKTEHSSLVRSIFFSFFFFMSWCLCLSSLCSVSGVCLWVPRRFGQLPLFVLASCRACCACF